MKHGYMPFAAAIAAALSTCVAAADDAVLASGISPEFLVDTCDGPRIARGSADIAYAPVYSLGSAPTGSYVVLRKTDRPDTEHESSSVLSTCEADASGDCELTQEGSYVRLAHELRNANGTLVGETLVADVALTCAGGTSAFATVDSRTNSLQLAVKAERSAVLAYSTDWATNAASLRISAIRLAGPGGAATATNTVFTAEADADGDFALRNLDPGWWRLSCILDGESGDGLLEYLTAGFRMPGGFLLLLK